MSDPTKHQLVAKLQQQWLASVKPVVLSVRSDFVLRNISGDPSLYGFSPLSLDQNIRDNLVFLEGILSDDLDEEMELPFLQVNGGSVANVLIAPAVDGWEIMFTSAEDEHDQLQLDQQKAYDLTLLKRKIEKANKNLEKVNSLLEEANLAKGRFIANMSHEFRTPLTSIMGYSELVQKMAGIPSKGNDYLFEIDRAAQHLLVMIDNLLDQARIDAGQLDILSAPFELNEIIGSVASLMKPLAEKKGLAFKQSFSDELPEVIQIDGMRLKQMLINLLGNAVKYTQKGSIQFIAENRNNNLVCRIVDTGPGIDEKHQKKVFQPFEQNNVMEKGAGLGLAITKKMCEMMGGELSLRSEKGEGSEFMIKLPLIEGELISKTSQEPVINENVDLSQYKVLLVEDDEDIQFLLDIHLSTLGCQYKIANHGQEALDIYGTYAPDVVLMDMNMPVMDGMTATKSMRQRGFSRPIIALTASISASSREKVLASGCTDFLQKPIDRETMLSVLTHYLTQSRHEKTKAIA